MLNNRGEKIYKEIISESNNVLINVDIVVDSENNLFLFWEKYIKINEYTMQLNTSFCRKITNNGTIIFEKELDFKRLSDIEIDKNNNLHVVSKNKYRILDNEIKVITGPIIYSNNVTSVPKLALDNYDNAYIVWDFEEEVGEQTRYESPNLFQTVYCTKIINDGNISIKEKKIDSDWKKSNEMISPLYFCLITFVVFIIIAIVIIIWYKRNKRESLKL